MKEHLINKKLKELCPKGHLTNKNNRMLFQEFEKDKLNNVLYENSEARTLLILGNQKLIYFILKNRFGLIIDANNLDEFSVGQIGLVKAVDTYNVNSGIQFNTYACKVITNEIHMYYRTINNKANYAEKTKVFLEDFIPDSDTDGSQTRILDTIYDDHNFVDEIMDRTLIDNVIKNIKYLSYDEMLTIIYSYGLFGKDKITQEQIAQKLNISRGLVAKYLKDSLNKLKVLSLSKDQLSTEEQILRYKILKGGTQINLNEYFIWSNEDEKHIKYP